MRQIAAASRRCSSRQGIHQTSNFERYTINSVECLLTKSLPSIRSRNPQLGTQNAKPIAAILCTSGLRGPRSNTLFFSVVKGRADHVNPAFEPTLGTKIEAMGSGNCRIRSRNQRYSGIEKKIKVMASNPRLLTKSTKSSQLSILFFAHRQPACDYRTRRQSSTESQVELLPRFLDFRSGNEMSCISNERNSSRPRLGI
jgi:hypothetical protein